MKKSLLVEKDGGPLAAAIAGANVPDARLLDETIRAVVLERPEPDDGYEQHLCKGDYFRLAPRHAGICRHLVYPVPVQAGLGIHISFDLDVVDPTQAPGVGTPVPGGISYREAHLIMELAAETGGLTSLDLVEVNPIHDHENRTAKLAADLILSALGRTIA